MRVKNIGMKISYVFHQPGKFSARLTRGEVVMGSGDKVIFFADQGHAKAVLATLQRE
jgi:hypothetical protein